LIVVVALSFGLLGIPYGHWKLLTVKICGIERVTPHWLIDAAAKGEKPLLKHLIANGFDINTRNWAGEGLLTIAKRTGRTSTSEWLIAHGARE
jgi:Ankyrin repeats (many copies)